MSTQDFPSIWIPVVPEPEDIRKHVLATLRGAGHALTPKVLWLDQGKDNWKEYEAELKQMELDHLVILHRDSSAGTRHAAEWGGIALVALRRQ